MQIRSWPAHEMRPPGSHLSGVLIQGCLPRGAALIQGLMSDAE